MNQGQGQGHDKMFKMMMMWPLHIVFRRITSIECFLPQRGAVADGQTARLVRAQPGVRFAPSQSIIQHMRLLAGSCPTGAFMSPSTEGPAADGTRAQENWKKKLASSLRVCDISSQFFSCFGCRVSVF